MVLCICPTLFFLHCDHKFDLYDCVSIPALQIGSSVPSFWIPYIYIRYLFFSDFTLYNRL